jgi:transcriptional regulator with XRE-family HTH domain
MITIRSRRHAAQIFRHLREAQGITRLGLARRLHVSPRTIEDRETHRNGIPTDALIDTAAHFGLDVALVPARRRGVRPTGTGWPT